MLCISLHCSLFSVTLFFYYCRAVWCSLRPTFHCIDFMKTRSARHVLTCPLWLSQKLSDALLFGCDMAHLLCSLFSWSWYYQIYTCIIVCGKTAILVLHHDAQLLLNKQQQILGGVYILWYFSSNIDMVVLPCMRSIQVALVSFFVYLSKLVYWRHNCSKS